MIQKLESPPLKIPTSLDSSSPPATFRIILRPRDGDAGPPMLPFQEWGRRGVVQFNWDSELPLEVGTVEFRVAVGETTRGPFRHNFSQTALLIPEEWDLLSMIHGPTGSVQYDHFRIDVYLQVELRDIVNTTCRAT